MELTKNYTCTDISYAQSKAKTTMEAVWPAIDTCYKKRRLFINSNSNSMLLIHITASLFKSQYMYRYHVNLYVHHCSSVVSEITQSTKKCERRNCAALLLWLLLVLLLLFVSLFSCHENAYTHSYQCIKIRVLYAIYFFYQFLCQIFLVFIKTEEKENIWLF